MKVLLSIALRNLKEHRGKTYIIGILVALGVYLLILGNALLTTASEGTKKSVIDNYTGHLMIRAKSQTPVSITGAASMTGQVTGRTIPEYSKIFGFLNTLPEIESANPQITSFAQIDFSTENQNRGAIAFLFGIEPQSYQGMFHNNLEILEGSFLESGQQGVVLPLAMAEEIREKLEIDLQVGDELKFQSLGAGAGMAIRRVPVVGIYRFLVDSPALSGFSFIDAQSLRSMNGMVLGASVTQEVRDEDASLLSLAQSDDVFSESFDFDSLFGITDIESTENSEFDEEELLTFLGDPGERAALIQPDQGAWSYLLIKLTDPNTADGVSATLTNFFAQENLEAEVVDWAVASGGVATFNQAFQTFFLVVVILITLVSIIIIMNTLVISVIERTYEIGTMRALGAQRKFIRKMFIFETMGISFVFGFLGLLLGLGTVLILNITGLAAPNSFFELIFGGEVLRPVLSWGSILQAFIMMTGIGYLSSLYPVSVALKIQPIKAIQTT